MSAGFRSSAAGIFILLAIAWGSGSVPAVGSEAVPRTIVGCVVDGDFISSDGYHIHPRYADGREVDLLPFEGRKLTIAGDLLPGDLFIVKEPPRDSGPCEAK